MSGELPEGWVNAVFDEVANVAANLVEPSEYQQFPHIAPNHIESNSGKLLPYMTVEADGVMSAKHLFRPGQILYSKIRPYLAKAVLVDFEGLCSADMYPIDTEIEPRFLFRWMLGSAFTELASRSQGRTVLPKINKKALGVLRVPVPPLNEQKRIVAKIDALTEKSREARQALDEVPALLDQLRQSILAAAFRGDLTKKWREQNPNVEPASVLLDRIRTERRRKWEEAELAKFQAKGKVPKGDDWKSKYKEPDPVDPEGLPELPEGWCWARMSELAEDRPNAIGAGPFGTIFKAKDFRDSGVPIIFLRHVAPGEYRTHKPGFMDTDVWDQLYKEEYSVYGGELLVTKLGDPPGTAAIYPEGIGAAMVTPDVIKMCVNQGLSLTGYLMHYMNSEVARLFTFGAAYGVTRLRMNLTIFREMPVPVAPKLEQERLLAQLATADEFIRSSMSQATNSSQELTSLDSSILAKAFRGELVPQDPNDEPASVLLERIRKEREGGGSGKKKAGRKKTA